MGKSTGLKGMRWRFEKCQKFGKGGWVYPGARGGEPMFNMNSSIHIWGKINKIAI